MLNYILRKMDKSGKKKIIYITLVTLLLFTLLVSLAIGAMKIPLYQVWLGLCKMSGLYTSSNLDEQYLGVLELVRVPRAVLGILIGAALGIAGAAIQGVFRNPLAEPGLVGMSAGASLMSALIILLEASVFTSLSLWLGHYLLVLGAFAGAVLAAIIVYQISRTEGKPLVATMLLAGIAINALAGALTGLISFMADDQQLRSITFWMLGSLAGASWETITGTIPFILIPVLILPTQGKKLNTFALGELQASQLGIRPDKLKQQVIVLATLAVGASVAVCGIIGFVGLVVPHIVRLLGGMDNRYVLPASALMGALLLTLSDMLCRVLLPPMELPIGIVTALLGTPVFLYILMKDKKKFLR
jgi:iron complex transport system permease protein